MLAIQRGFIEGVNLFFQEQHCVVVCVVACGGFLGLKNIFFFCLLASVLRKLLSFSKVHRL